MSFSNRARGAFLAAAAAAFLSILPFPGAASSQSDEPKKAPPPRSLTQEEEQKLRLERELREDRKKIGTIIELIQGINKKLKLRTAGQEIFDQKQALENRLRDKITHFEMTDQAMAEATRLAREVEEIHRTARKGPKNSRRQQLANFLEARRREYITFATR